MRSIFFLLDSHSLLLAHLPQQSQHTTTTCGAGGSGWCTGDPQGRVLVLVCVRVWGGVSWQRIAIIIKHAYQSECFFNCPARSPFRLPLTVLAPLAHVSLYTWTGPTNVCTQGVCKRKGQERHTCLAIFHTVKCLCGTARNDRDDAKKCRAHE